MFPAIPPNPDFPTATKYIQIWTQSHINQVIYNLPITDIIQFTIKITYSVARSPSASPPIKITCWLKSHVYRDVEENKSTKYEI
jgi:hypothetical protein